MAANLDKTANRWFKGQNKSWLHDLVLLPASGNITRTVLFFLTLLFTAMLHQIRRRYRLTLVLK